MKVIVVPDCFSRVRWSSFGEGGVVDSVELDVDKLLLACDWMSELFGGDWVEVRERLWGLRAQVRHSGGEGAVVGSDVV